jgi:hypothetical protein
MQNITAQAVKNRAVFLLAADPYNPPIDIDSVDFVFGAILMVSGKFLDVILFKDY